MFVSGLTRLLEPDFHVVGAANDGMTLLREASRLQPELIITDISMPELNGLEALRRLHLVAPASRSVILTMHCDPAMVKEAARLGARAYLLKRDAADVLIAALHEVMQGGTRFPRFNKEDSEIDPPNAPPASLPDARLTARQRQILQLVAAGKTHKEIATQLHMSAKTVEFHKYRMMRALGLHTTAELTRAAIRAHIVTP